MSSSTASHRSVPPLGRPHLEGWKEIGGYFGRTVRTVQRWEREQGLPVRRHFHADLSSVYADPADLDAWRKQHQPQTMNGPDAAPVVSFDEHALCVMSREQWARRTRDGLQKSIALAHAALARNPQYGGAYALLALIHATRASYGHRPPIEDLRLAREYADRAIALDADLVEAHQALGFIRLYYDWNFPEARAVFDRAIALDPNNPTTLQWLTLWYIALERDDEAYELAQQAEALAPESLVVAAHSGWVLHWAGRNDEAMERAQSLIRKDRHFWRGHMNLGFSLIALNRYSEAAAALQVAAALNDQTNITAMLAHAVARAGDRTRATELLGQLTSGRTYVSPYWLAFAYAGLGDTTEALARLRKSLRHREWFLLLLKHEPGFEELRARSGFDAVRQSVGLS